MLPTFGAAMNLGRSRNRPGPLRRATRVACRVCPDSPPRFGTRWQRPRGVLGFLVLLLGSAAGSACDLCALFNTVDARTESGRFLFTLSGQYVPFRTTQVDGEEVTVANPSYFDRLVTHLVPTYNVSSRFGVSLNVPLTHLDFKRTDLLFSASAPPTLVTEQGTDFGLGDVALIGRATVFQVRNMASAVLVNVLGGIKFPTGDASRIEEEVAQAELFESFLPPGTPHDPLGHSVASVHPHDLALGSGSFDGIFGLTANTRWNRWSLNAQFQYYLRTAGESDFQYGDELMVSGGPGAYLLLRDSLTLNLQLNAAYDTKARDELTGRPSDRTGSTAWYMGPLLSLTWGSHFSANFGADLPLRIANNGFQSVPDYRLHGGLTWRF